MTPDKIREVISRYRQEFLKSEIPKRKFSRLDGHAPLKHILAHCYWMVDEIERFLQEKRMAKANRWLGFVQGTLWGSGRYTIADLMNHNRPK